MNSEIALLVPKREPEEIDCAVDCLDGYLPTRADASDGNVGPCFPKRKNGGACNMKVPLESALGAHQAAHLLQLWLGFQTEDAPPECMGKQQFQPCLCNEHFTKLGSTEKHEDMIQGEQYPHY
ncbi:hypothetical protein MRX96_038855 [Rhipicephalus microplus]